MGAVLRAEVGRNPYGRGLTDLVTPNPQLTADRMPVRPERLGAP